MVFRVDICNEWNAARFCFWSTSVCDLPVYNFFKFADYTKIYRTEIAAEDVSALQPDPSNLVGWSKEWQMLFSVGKCEFVHLGYNNVQAEYVINDVKLEVGMCLG